MNYELSQRFYFEAAHTLNRSFETESSKRIHGHTYHAEVFISGTPDSNGMVMDLAELRSDIERVRGMLDHHFLDDICDLGPPTLENLCAFIFAQLRSKVKALTAVSVERPASGDKCVVRAPQSVQRKSTAHAQTVEA